MNRHLSSDEISGWVIGERNSEATQHVEGCQACRTEVTRLGNVLTEFRGSVRELPASTRLNTRFIEARSGFVYSNWPKLVWALAVLILCLAVGYSVKGRHDQQFVAETSTDAALLKQVDAALSREVPGAMEPLAKLVSWDGNSGSKKSE